MWRVGSAYCKSVLVFAVGSFLTTAGAGCGARTEIGAPDGGWSHSTDADVVDAGIEEVGAPDLAVDATTVTPDSAVEDAYVLADVGMDGGSDGGGTFDVGEPHEMGPDADMDAGWDVGVDSGWDAYVCVPSVETCNGVDDDCDGLVDGPTASAACSLAQATSECRMGACLITDCEVGFDDCNRSSADGCEADLGSEDTCGACDVSCSALAMCFEGGCARQRADHLSVGGYTSCVLRPSGDAYCWGSNGGGAAGSGLTGSSQLPTRVPDLPAVSDLDVGGSHSCAIGGGVVYCWGEGLHGELGMGPLTRANTPLPVAGITDAVEVSAGGFETCVRHATGEVSCWGWNQRGGVGDGTTDVRDRPVRVVGITNVVDIEVASRAACALSMDGVVRCWGSNGAGLIGDGTLVDRYRPTRVPGLPGDVVHIRSAPENVCAITRSGDIWCWGWQFYGQLCGGALTLPVDEVSERPRRITLLMDIIESSGSGFHSTYVEDSGQVWSCGDGQGGGLGDGSPWLSEEWAPVRVPLFDAVDVSVGREHSCVLRASGAVACWGENGYRQLGDGTYVSRRSPVAVQGLPL